MRKLTTEEFKSNFYQKFGTKYNLDNITYVDNKTPITITCPIHGSFSIRPTDLMRGHGCPKCGGTQKSNTKEWIEKASFVHNNYFSYDKTEYQGANNKVIVTCPIHGNFEVKASNHLRGVNCQKCKQENIKHQINKLPQTNSSTKKLDTSTFKRIFFEKFGDKYDLGKVEYINNRTKVIATCPIHGDFQITPQKLLSGRGCTKCANNYQYTTEEFIEIANSIHNNVYCYDKTLYKTTHSHITVTCPIHGDFITTPARHLQGRGCPHCKQSHMEKDIQQLLEENNIKFEYQKKFDWLGMQSLDFYLPDYNIAIECQGIQHFEPIKFFGGKKNFKKQLIRDTKKQLLCSKYNLKLLYYTNIEKYQDKLKYLNIDELLNIVKNL